MEKLTGNIKPIRYVALLRGINVGAKMVKMEIVRNLMATMGYENVKTLLNSGNVLFDSAEKDITQLTEKLENVYEKEFCFHIDVILRKMEDIVHLVESEPFKDFTLTPQTRFYVTFLSEPPKNKVDVSDLPPDNGFQIIKILDDVVLSVLTLSPANKTGDAMKKSSDAFGKKITTRNWNTVKKIILYP